MMRIKLTQHEYQLGNWKYVCKYAYAQDPLKGFKLRTTYSNPLCYSASITALFLFWFNLIIFPILQLSLVSLMIYLYSYIQTQGVHYI